MPTPPHGTDRVSAKSSDWAHTTAHRPQMHPTGPRRGWKNRNWCSMQLSGVINVRSPPTRILHRTRVPTPETANGMRKSLRGTLDPGALSPNDQCRASGPVSDTAPTLHVCSARTRSESRWSLADRYGHSAPRCNGLGFYAQTQLLLSNHCCRPASGRILWIELQSGQAAFGQIQPLSLRLADNTDWGSALKIGR